MGRLIDQVSKINPAVEVSLTESDGFRVYRRVQFDAQTLKVAGDALRLVAQNDARIVQMDSNGIRFVSTIDADRADEFPLQAVQAVLKPAKKTTGVKRERQAATKKATKKAAKKS
jgi:hypothetical protein